MLKSYINFTRGNWTKPEVDEIGYTGAVMLHDNKIAPHGYGALIYQGEYYKSHWNLGMPTSDLVALIPQNGSLKISYINKESAVELLQQCIPCDTSSIPATPRNGSDVDSVAYQSSIINDGSKDVSIDNETNQRQAIPTTMTRIIPVVADPVLNIGAMSGNGHAQTLLEGTVQTTTPSAGAAVHGQTQRVKPKDASCCIVM